MPDACSPAVRPPGSPYAKALRASQRLLAAIGAVLKKAQSAAAAGEPLPLAGLICRRGSMKPATLGDDDRAEAAVAVAFCRL